MIHSQAQKIGEFQQAIAEQKFQINEQKRELLLLKDFMRAMRSCNPAMKALAEQMERDDVVRWSNSLTRARILRWGGIISTPDPELQVYPLSSNLKAVLKLSDFVAGVSKGIFD